MADVLVLLAKVDGQQAQVLFLCQYGIGIVVKARCNDNFQEELVHLLGRCQVYLTVQGNYPTED